MGLTPPHLRGQIFLSILGVVIRIGLVCFNSLFLSLRVPSKSLPVPVCRAACTADFTVSILIQFLPQSVGRGSCALRQSQAVLIPAQSASRNATIFCQECKSPDHILSPPQVTHQLWIGLSVRNRLTVLQGGATPASEERAPAVGGNKAGSG